MKDPFTAGETIALLRRFDAEENSRSQSVYGACGLPGVCTGRGGGFIPNDDAETLRRVALLCGPTGESPHSDPA